MFWLYFLAVCSRKCLEKFSWCQVWVFLGFVLSSFGFFRRRLFRLFLFCFFSRDIAQVVTGHPHTHLFACSFFLFVPRRACCFARFGRASCFSAFSRGAILGPARFWDSPCTLPRPFSWDARRQGFSVLLLPCFSFSRFVLFCGHTFYRRPSRWSRRSGQRVISPAPLPEWGQGGAPRGRRVGPLLVPLLSCF